MLKWYQDKMDSHWLKWQKAVDDFDSTTATVHQNHYLNYEQLLAHKKATD